jgi:hypothetical protein|tara:strand:- start:1010 stop:1342 length:333 start_codon:yes stop_codon:yes gene_type:complete
MSAEFNIVINQNADFTRKFKLKTPGTTDITNYTITSAMKKHHTTPDASDTDFTVTKTDASAGDFTISLTDTQTAALKAGVYQYDILSADGSGIKTTLVSGTATVEAGITP